jgi:hypothetical protein
MNVPSGTPIKIPLASPAPAVNRDTPSSTKIVFLFGEIVEGFENGTHAGQKFRIGHMQRGRGLPQGQQMRIGVSLAATPSSVSWNPLLMSAYPAAASTCRRTDSQTSLRTSVYCGESTTASRLSVCCRAIV